MTQKSRSIGYRFAVLHRLNRFFIAEKIKALGITPAQLPFMAELLYADEPMVQEQLSVRVEIDKAATARALDQMEKKGLVERCVNETNRRQKLVRATPKARELEAAFFDCLRTGSRMFIKGFEPEEIDTLLGLMDRMMANAKQEKYGKE